VAFHFRTVMAPAARPARARRVFSARWVGDDAAFADRGGVTSPPFPELTLRDGDPLDSPLFPRSGHQRERLRTGSAMIPPFAVWSLSMFNDAIVYDRYGPPAAVLTLKRAPLAPLAGGRVRVRMRYAPVNPSDLIPITGAYRHRTRLPAVPGYEGLGEVVAARHSAAG
jgi:hypothetical protein